MIGKNPLEEIQKNPTFYLFVVVMATGFTVFLTFKFASTDYVEEKIKDVKGEITSRHEEIKRSMDIREDKFRAELTDIKSTLKDLDKNILEIYKEIKLQEGRNEKNRK